jgi:hypothetical protein
LLLLLVEYSSSIETFEELNNRDSLLFSFDNGTQISDDDDVDLLSIYSFGIIGSANMILSLFSSRLIRLDNQSESVCSVVFSSNGKGIFSKINSLLFVVVVVVGKI